MRVALTRRIPLCRDSPTPVMTEHQQNNSSQSADRVPVTPGAVIADLVRHPLRRLVWQWNWKAALMSCLLRSLIFFTVNLTAGLSSALDALLTEFMYRAIMTGFLASLSQAFRRVQQAWKASLILMLVLPAIAHGIEFTVHSLRGTARLYESVAVSVLFSMFSVVLSYMLQRRSLLVVGEGGRPLLTDVVSMPGVILDLLLLKPVRLLRNSNTRKLRPDDH